MKTPPTTFIELQERPRGTRCCDTDCAPRFSDAETQQLSDDMQLLGHPIRLRILDILTRNEGQVCVCDLEAELPVKQPTVSHHLRLLREAGVIDCERHGLWAYYFVRREALAARRTRLTQALEALA